MPTWFYRNAALLALFPLLASAAGTAAVRVTNSGAVPITVAGQTIRPFATATISVPAGEAGAFAATATDGFDLSAPASYPSLRAGGSYSIRLSAVRAPVAVPVPAAPAAGGETAPAAKPEPASRAETVSPREILEFRTALADNPVAALASFGKIGSRAAEQSMQRMCGEATVGNPVVFRDFVRRSVFWCEPAGKNRELAAFYNPWVDGAVVFAVETHGVRRKLVGNPAIVAGETIRGERFSNSDEPNPPFPGGNNPARDLPDAMQGVREAFRRLAPVQGIGPGGSFSSWNSVERKANLDAVSARIERLVLDQLDLSAEEEEGSLPFADGIKELLEIAEGREPVPDTGGVWSFFRQSDGGSVLRPYLGKTTDDRLVCFLQRSGRPEEIFFAVFGPEDGHAEADMIDLRGLQK